LSDIERSARHLRPRPVEGQPARGIEAQGADRGHGHDPRQQPVLHRVDARRQRGLVVGGQNGDSLLGHDGTSVERLVHEMHGHARHRDAGGERPGDRVHARERGQQRRMHVDDAPAEGAERLGAEHPHEPSQHDHVWRDLLEACREAQVPRGAVRVTRGRHQHHRDPLLDRPVERRTHPVREYADDAPAQYPARLGRPERPKVAPLP
jgi:hypothetical protein